MTMVEKHLAEALDNLIDASAFSGVVSIRLRDCVVYERASGYADRSNTLENTLATRFGIASGTKFLTALAIGKLVSDQKLSFSTRLKDCVALDFPRYSPDITIQHLLTHTSGIADYYDEEKVPDCADFTVSVPWCELRGPRDYLTVFPDEPMKFEPGERFSYSNGGYILLGVVIEELTGVTYQGFVEQAIFKTIGMNRSGFFALNQLPENTALGYVDDASGWRTNVYNLPIVGASDGGAFTTADDVATLWRSFWAFEILPKEMVQLYTRPLVATDTQREDRHYGCGLWIRENEDGTHEVSMSGCDAGVSFKSSVDRSADLRVTVISNTTQGAWPVVEGITKVLRSLSGN
jgi:CubicO group peptidase (beta-lactamase class C family)